MGKYQSFGVTGRRTEAWLRVGLGVAWPLRNNTGHIGVKDSRIVKRAVLNCALVRQTETTLE